MLLQACPSCSRQFDVSHLAPGDSVRCICDVRFTVRDSKDLRVQGLRCTHCGAPVRSQDEECTYCTAALDERTRTSSRCPSCLERLDKDAAHCSACGTRIKPDALPPIPAGKGCPRCKAKLQIRSLDVVHVIECEDCGGLWLDPQVFTSMTNKARRGHLEIAGKEPEVRAKSGARPAQSYIPCLDCGDMMLRRQFTHRARPTGVVLDYCRDHGIWFDGEELSTILAAIQNGWDNAPDESFIQEALRPRVTFEKLPKGVKPDRSRRARNPYMDLLHSLTDILFH